MFKNKHEDMRSIGNQLGVVHLLEGSIRKADSRLRITAQLIKVSDGTHLWSEKFDRDMNDIFAIQDEIALAIVENLKTKLVKSEREAILKHYTENSEIYNLYLLGRFYTNKRNTESLTKAIHYYEEAIEKDPRFALAYAGLSEAYNLCAIGYSALPSTETFPKAKKAALKAIELDDELAEAHTSLAFTKQYFEFDWPEVEREWKRAIALNPGFAPAHQWYGEYLFMHKRWKESYEEIFKALELDPLSFIIRNELGWFYHYQDKIDRAIEEYKKVIEMAPDYAVVYFNMGSAYVIKGYFDDAIEYAKKSVELSEGSPFMKAGLAYAYAKSGRKDLALEIRDELVKLADSGYMCFGALATIYVGLEEKDEALQCMEKGIQNKESLMAGGRMFFENYIGSYLVSNEPRFIALQKKLGFE
jgi:serine/threonine-protein kinase